MKILITDTKMIRTLQKQFNAEFPHLKIEFFSKRHSAGEASAMENLVDHDRLLGEFRFKHNNDKIEITADMTVAELEQHFWNSFGLSVQVFRLMGNAWVETITTDNWTLTKQEELAANAYSEEEN